MNIAGWLFSAADGVLPILSKLPFSAHARGLEALLNKALAGPLAEGEFNVLQGRWLLLRISDLRLCWYVSVKHGRLVLAKHAQADVSITGQWREFLLLASREEDPDTLFFRRRLLLEGDTELGLALKNLIDSLDPETLPQWLWRVLQNAGQQLSGLQRQTTAAQH